MKTIKSKVNATTTQMNSKDDKIIIRMEDYNDEEEEDDRKSTDNLSCSNESGFGTVDEINSIESDNSLKQLRLKNNKDTIAILNLNNNNNNNNTMMNSLQLFQQQNQSNANEPQFHIDQELHQNQPKPINSNLYDDNLVILSTSANSLSTTVSSSTFSRRLEENRFLRYLCFLCTCCKTTNTIFWSWLSIFCCCCPLLGLCSLYCTYKSKKYKLKQKYDLSDKYSSYAEKLNIASLIFGILFYAVAFFIITLVLFMYWRHSNV